MKDLLDIFEGSVDYTGFYPGVYNGYPKRHCQSVFKEQIRRLRERLVDWEKDSVVFVIHQHALSFQILHAMGKIPEDEIWLPEPESVVGSILFHELISFL